MIYQLTHTYSLLKKDFYGMETNLSLIEFQYPCAYLQLIRDKLPSLSSIDDCIGENEAAVLLPQFYGFKPFYEPIQIDGILDFHHNWECYVIEGDIDKINQYAIPNATAKVVEYFCVEIEKWLIKHPQDTNAKKDLERFKKLLSGESVKEEWNWQNIKNESLTGFKLINSKTPELISPFY
ncbi:hypothetical protein ACAX46_004175 [Providencia rettgeri]